MVAPYGFPRKTVDGNDVHAVRKAFGGFLRKARKGEGPFLLECLTHRLGGHYEGDPQHYREAIGDEEWRAIDPILRLGGGEGLEEEARAEVEEAVEFARDEPLPAGRAGRRSWCTHEQRPTWRRSHRRSPRRCATTSACSCSARTSPRAGRGARPPGSPRSSAPERVRNTPISEAAIAGIAIGAAQSGLRPVVEIMFVDFVTLALDQLVNQAAKAHFMSGGQLTVPLVLRTQGGAGQRGGAQHSQSLEAWLTHVPGLKVVMPATAADAAGLLRAAIADPNPVVYRREQDALLPAGGARARGACRSAARGSCVRGRDVTVVALSRLVHEAVAAAEELAGEGIEVEVIDPRTLVPLDLETIVESVSRTHRLVVAHEAVVHGGFGAEIAAQVQAAAFDELDAPVVRVGGSVHAGAVQPAARGRLARRAATRWPRGSGRWSHPARKSFANELSPTRRRPYGSCSPTGHVPPCRRAPASRERSTTERPSATCPRDHSRSASSTSSGTPASAAPRVHASSAAFAVPTAT